MRELRPKTTGSFGDSLRDGYGLGRALHGSRQPIGERKRIMRTLLEHDSVALAVLVIGIAAVELLALSF
jgi:hypothetical protein